MFEPFLLVAAGWSFHLVIGVALVGTAAYFGRRRAELEPWEGMVFLIPFFLWLGVSVASWQYPKNPTNLLIEPGLLGLAIGLAGIARVLLANRIRQDRLAFSLLLAVLVFALVLARSAPRL